MELLKLTPEEADLGIRADAWLAAELDISRSAAAILLESGSVTSLGKPVKKNEKVKAALYEVTRPDPKPLDTLPENIPLDIVYEDAHLLVVNKPRGMVVHPAAGNPDGTLVNAVLFHCGDLSGIGGVERPGIVHRLDKDTSGCIVVAKNDNAHLSLTTQFANRDTSKIYLAVVQGCPKESSGTVFTNIGRPPVNRLKMAVVTPGSGKPAITDWQVLQYDPATNASLVMCTLHTGRTHQIRVHMEYLGYPIVGDPKYSPMKTPFSINGQALHSLTLDFIHPRTGEAMHFEAPLPEDMHKIVTRLRLGQFT